MDTKKPTDLVKALKKGDIPAFEEIYKSYNKRIYSISLKLLKSNEDAENIVQEVFLKLWRKREDLKEHSNFDAYLFTIAYNTIRDQFSKSSRERQNQDEFTRSIQPVDDSTNAEIEYHSLLESVKKAVNKLPPRQKTVYLLNMNDGLTCDEISKKLGISERTVEVHLQKAKSHIKKLLIDSTLISILFVWLFV